MHHNKKEGAQSDSDKGRVVSLSGGKSKTIWWIIGAFVVLFAWKGILLQNTFRTAAFDFAIYDQSVWNIAKNFSTANSVNGFGNSFGAHFQPILFLLAPFYWIWNNPRMLIILEVLIVGLGALPVWNLAERKFKNRFFTLSLVFAYLFFIGNRSALAFPFHPSTFLAPLLLFAYDYFDQKRWGWHWFFIVLALLVKENAGNYVAVFGLVLFLTDRRYWKLAIGYGVLGIGWLAIETKLILPMISNRDYSFFYFKTLGDNQMSAMVTIVKNPVYVIRLMLENGAKIRTFLTSFLGSGFIALTTPFALLGLPSLGERLLSTRPAMWLANVYYGAPMAWAFIISTLKGVEKWTNNRQLKTDNKEKWLNMVSVVMILGTLVLVINEPLTGLRFDGWKVRDFKEKKEFWQAVKMVPQDKVLAAQSQLVPQIAHRKEIYRYPEGNPEYILLSIDTKGWPMTPAVYRREIGKLLKDKNWGLIYNQGGILLWQKGVKDKVGATSRVKEYLKNGKSYMDYSEIGDNYQAPISK
ncbi:MAG: DUF2079 domain-containing protein [Candidatus Pacebacteria bacterium]|nr:DUF2079 domain-containing protein [Candidatus Paceibacterota bacterium]